MPNRRYLAWLIAGAYATPQGGFHAPDATILRGQGDGTDQDATATDAATKTSRNGHRRVADGR